MDCAIRVAKTKALISFAVTAKLICAFAFAYAKSRFSHDAAQIVFKLLFLFMEYCLLFILYRLPHFVFIEYNAVINASGAIVKHYKLYN